MPKIAKNKYFKIKNWVYMGSNMPIDNQESKELEQKGGDLSDKIEALNKINKKLRRYLICASNLVPDSTEPTGWMMNYLINLRGAEFVERQLGRDIAPYFPQMLEIIYEQAKQLTNTQQALDSALEALKLARDLKDNIHKHKDGSVRQWAIQVGKMAEAALASIKEQLC